MLHLYVYVYIYIMLRSCISLDQAYSFSLVLLFSFSLKNWNTHYNIKNIIFRINFYHLELTFFFFFLTEWENLS